jgi:hypothetical protein
MLTRMQEDSGVDLPWMPGYGSEKIARRNGGNSRSQLDIGPTILREKGHSMPDNTTTKQRIDGSKYRFDDLTTLMILDDLHFRRDDPGPGEKLPDFDLPTTQGGRFRSADLGSRPVFMIFGSRTCPITESSGPHLMDLHESYGSGIRFVMVNTREAHPGEIITQPRSADEKFEHAVALQDHHGFAFEVAVDDIDGTLHRTLGPKPNSAYLVDREGTILYRAHWANDHQSLEPILAELLQHGTVSRGKSRAFFRPLLMAIGHLPGIVREAGRKTGRDVWRAVPPLAVLASISRAFPHLEADRRGLMAALSLAATTITTVLVLARLG